VPDVTRMLDLLDKFLTWTEPSLGFDRNDAPPPAAASDDGATSWLPEREMVGAGAGGAA